MEKRLFVFLLLTILWLFVWQSFFARPPEKKPAQPAQPAGGSTSAPAEPGAEPPPAGAPESAPGEHKVVSQGDDELVRAESEESFQLDIGKYRLVFSNRGAALERLLLRGLDNRPGLSPEEIEQPRNWTALVDRLGSRKRALELEILRDPNLVGPQGLASEKVYGALRLNEELWRATWLKRDGERWSAWDASADPETARAGLRFELAQGGLRFTKELFFTEEAGRWDFHLRLSVGLQKAADPRYAGKPIFLGFTPAAGLYTSNDGFYPDPVACRALLDDDEYAFDTEKPHGKPVGPAWFAAKGKPLVFFGIFNKHFALVARPAGAVIDSGALTQVGYASYEVATAGADEHRLRVKDGERFYGMRSFCLLKFVLQTTPRVLDFDLYAGPKDPHIFDSRAAYGAYNAIIDEFDYGGFFYSLFFAGPVASVLLTMLEFFGSLFGNYGLAIVVVTLIVRLLLFPVNRRQQISMAAYGEKMKKLQPEIAKIKERYKNDSKKASQKQFELMRQNGVSVPLGGCLPVFLQMPIFIGLFAGLRTTILLRHEPFVLWIQDLSAPDALVTFKAPVSLLLFSIDTLNLLPLLMVVLWVLHQKMMPKPASVDPQQQTMMKMMTFMPILFGLFLYKYASGLALYMIVSSLLGIFEVRVIKKKWPIEDQVKRFQEKKIAKQRRMKELRERIAKAQKKQKKKGFVTR